MNAPILFRGELICTGEVVEGFLYQRRDGKTFITPERLIDDWALKSAREKTNHGGIVGYVVVPYTVEIRVGGVWGSLEKLRFAT